MHARSPGSSTFGGALRAAAADLIARHGPGPISEADVRKGLEGNLCRCTGYQNIVKAVQAAAESMAGVPA